MAHIETIFPKQRKLPQKMHMYSWVYRRGGADTIQHSTQMQCNPIIIDGVLYAVTPDHQAFALDAQTGKEIWRSQLKEETFNMTSRGMSFWKVGEDQRIFFGFSSACFTRSIASKKFVFYFTASETPVSALHPACLFSLQV